MEPVLLDSKLATDKSLAPVRPMVASDHNEWKATRIFHVGLPKGQITTTIFPFFVHTIFGGLVPPFSAFFCAILAHYQH